MYASTLALVHREPEDLPKRIRETSQGQGKDIRPGEIRLRGEELLDFTEVGVVKEVLLHHIGAESSNMRNQRGKTIIEARGQGRWERGDHMEREQPPNRRGDWMERDQLDHRRERIEPDQQDRRYGEDIPNRAELRGRLRRREGRRQQDFRDKFQQGRDRSNIDRGGKSRRDGSSDGSDVDVSQRYGMDTGHGGNRYLENTDLKDRIQKRQPEEERVPSRRHQGSDSSSEEREINNQRHNDNNEDSESETEKLGRAALASRSTRTVQLKKGSQSRKVQVKRGDALDSELEKEASKKHSSEDEPRRNVTVSSKLVEQKKAPVAQERRWKSRSPSSSPEPPPRRRGQRSRSRSPVRRRRLSSAASPVKTKMSKSQLPVRKCKSPSPIGSKRSPSRSPVRKRLRSSTRHTSRKSRSSSREDKCRNSSSSSRSRSRSRKGKPRMIRDPPFAKYGFKSRSSSSSSRSRSRGRFRSRSTSWDRHRRSDTHRGRGIDRKKLEEAARGGKSRRDSSSEGSDVDVSQRYGMDTGRGGNRDLEKIDLRDRIRKRQPVEERVPSRRHQGYDSSSEEREIYDQRHNVNNEDSESETEKLGRAALASRSTRTVQLKIGSQSRKVQVQRGDTLDSETEKEASKGKKHSRSSSLKNESRRNVTASSKLVEQKKAPVARERHQKSRSPSFSPEPPPRRGQRSRSRSPVRSRRSSSAASPVQTKRSKSKLPVRKRKSPSPIGSKRSPSRSPVRKRLWLSARPLSRKSRSSSREDKRRNSSSCSRSRSRSREGKPRKIRSEIEDSVSVMEDEDRTCFACQAKNETVFFDHPLFKAGKICLKCKKCLQQTLYAVDYDGCGLYCAICGDGGEMCVCDNTECRRVYCNICIIIHTDEDTLKKIENTSHWKCFLCEEYSPVSHGDLEAHEDWSLELVKFHQALNVLMSTDLNYLISEQKRKIRVLSLFDGIGTGKVALDMLGLDLEVYYASEIDEHARLVSSLHHEVKHVGNVLNLDLQRLKKICPIDLVLGGPPCNDLSIVNPRRKGFDGTGKLVWTFAAIVKDIERICEGYNHVFWLMENTAAMPKVYKQEINEKLGMEPAKWDAKHFSGQRRARSFWGNIPGMFTQPELNKLLESEKKDLSHAVYKCGRSARVPHSRTITTSANSLTITNGKNDHLVLMDGVPVPIWIPEIERLFGFHDHYTDAGLFLDKERQALLGRSWCVDVIKQLLSPLRSYFKVKQT